MQKKPTNSYLNVYVLKGRKALNLTNFVLDKFDLGFSFQHG